MLEQDESFEPNCKKCKDAYGFINLMEENFLAVELFQVLNSSIVVRGKLQQIMWNTYLEKIEDEGFNLLFRKLNELSTFMDEYKHEKEESQRLQAEAKAKVNRGHGIRRR
jgi:hypothetical protein|tara:strand:- start:251 stop:580 length:330 start_codon:yes stop_codon:yes gene_type:complete